MIRRILAILHARNIEFMRDRSTLGWNIVLPVVLVFGLAFIFSGHGVSQFRIGVVHGEAPLDASVHPFLGEPFIHFYSVDDLDSALARLERHQTDMLLDFTVVPPRYWINRDSPAGYMAEKVLQQVDPTGIVQGEVSGDPVRYVDWVMPGVLGMNMMFSCLFGVGYVVVRYRKNGFLKRLGATPLRAVEFVTAQLLSRLLLIMVITVVVYVGVKLLLDIRMDGSYAVLLLVALLGSITLISLGLLVAARIHSEELASGLVNMISWPMMLLSGVWFSLEGTHEWLQQAARLLPLTPILEAARAVMIDGAGIGGILPQLLALVLMSTLFLALGAWQFRWRAD